MKREEVREFIKTGTFEDVLHVLTEVITRLHAAGRLTEWKEWLTFASALPQDMANRGQLLEKFDKLP